MNPEIDENFPFLPDWYNKGIRHVCDVISSKGKLYTFRQLQIKY